MKQEEVKALSDSDLADLCQWSEIETQARAERRKQETIAKIRELAGSIDMPVKLGTRGRPPKPKTTKKS